MCLGAVCLGFVFAGTGPAAPDAKCSLPHSATPETLQGDEGGPRDRGATGDEGATGDKGGKGANGKAWGRGAQGPQGAGEHVLCAAVGGEPCRWANLPDAPVADTRDEPWTSERSGGLPCCLPACSAAGCSNIKCTTVKADHSDAKTPCDTIAGTSITTITKCAVATVGGAVVWLMQSRVYLALGSALREHASPVCP